MLQGLVWSQYLVSRCCMSWLKKLNLHPFIFQEKLSNCIRSVWFIEVVTAHLGYYLLRTRKTQGMGAEAGGSLWAHRPSQGYVVRTCLRQTENQKDLKGWQFTELSQFHSIRHKPRWSSLGGKVCLVFFL